MGTILDIVLCIVIFCFTFSGLKIGLVRSLVELVGSILSVIGAVLLANYFTSFVFQVIWNKQPSGALDNAVARVLATVILFALLQIVVHFLANALDALFRIPVLHQINALLGGVLGLLKGVVVVFLLCAALQLTLPLITEKYPHITQEELSKSYIYQYTYANNPVYNMYQAEI
jgi:membrane protein required for colicin V production